MPVTNQSQAHRLAQRVLNARPRHNPTTRSGGKSIRINSYFQHCSPRFSLASSSPEPKSEFKKSNTHPAAPLTRHVAGVGCVCVCGRLTRVWPRLCKPVLLLVLAHVHGAGLVPLHPAHVHNCDEMLVSANACCEPLVLA